jgi:transposase InsO family protein
MSGTGFHRRILAALSRLGLHAIDQQIPLAGADLDRLAVGESFFGNLKNELTHHRDFHTRKQARSEIFDYIEIFYNRQRAHATLQYMSPLDYESSSNGAQLNCPENMG